MLFEQVKLTAAKCHAIISRAFLRAAHKPAAAPCSSVPIPVLEAYGQLNRRIRYLCDARSAQGKLSRDESRRIRRLEKQLDRLPGLIIESLHTPAEEDWLEIYRHLVTLHETLLSSQLCVAAEEYECLVKQFIQLAQLISDHALIEISTSSLFALLLMQTHIKDESTARAPQSKPNRRPRRRKSSL